MSNATCISPLNILPHDVSSTCRLPQRLNSASILQQILQVPLLVLQIRVATNMLLPNEDVRHRRLARQVAERGLDRGAVIDLIQLNRIKLGAALTQQLLRRLAVRAVALAEHRDGVLVDDALHLGLGRRHAGWGQGPRSEQAADEGGNGGRLCAVGGVGGEVAWGCEEERLTLFGGSSVLVGHVHGIICGHPFWGCRDDNRRCPASVIGGCFYRRFDV